MDLFGWFSGRKRQSTPDELSVEQMPWDRHPSIYEHIKAHLDQDRAGLSEDGKELPDEERPSSDKVRWAAGAMDGVFAHHVGGASQVADAQKLLGLVQAYCGSPTARNKKAIYDQVLEGHVLGYIDPFLAELTKDRNLNPTRLYELARSFVIESPDREPVKLGASILGLFRQPGDLEVFLTLGCHDEFTLYCVVAIGNGMQNAEADLWELAKNVHGWGRIHIVEQLAKTEDPEIKQWLLREGYKNEILNEYLAYTCAVAGNLKAALGQVEVDDDLLLSAAEIIQALLAGGPAQNIDDYEDGAAVVDAFLRRTDEQPKSLSQFLAVGAIRNFLADEKADWKSREERWWTAAKRADMKDRCETLLKLSIWQALIDQGLKSADDRQFYEANNAAKLLELDTWRWHWERLQRAPENSGNWFQVMQVCNPDRISEIVDWADKTIPLATISTGAGDEMGLGPEYQAHSCLDYILQGLGGFPGHGYQLIAAGLRSPVTRNRNMALKALSEWGTNNWPPEARISLEAALAVEPNEDVRERIRKVIDGKPME